MLRHLLASFRRETVCSDVKKMRPLMENWLAFSSVRFRRRRGGGEGRGFGVSAGKQ